MKKLFSTLTTIALLIFIGQTAKAQTNQWRPVSGSRQDNISGMALIERTNLQTSFLIVHDNKKKEQTHVGIITVEGNNHLAVRKISKDKDNKIHIHLETTSGFKIENRKRIRDVNATKGNGIVVNSIYTILGAWRAHTALDPDRHNLD